MLQSTLASHSSALTQQRKQSLVKEAKIGTCQSRGGSKIQQPLRRLSISTAWGVSVRGSLSISQSSF